MKFKPFNYPLIFITLAMILGILFQNYSPMSLGKIVLIVMVSVLLGIFAFFKFEKWRYFSIFSIAFSVGLLIHFAHFEPNTPNHYSNILQENHFYLLEGKIVSIKGKNAIIALEKFENQDISGKIIGSFKDSISYKNIGKSILFGTHLSQITKPKNPYQFDFQKYMNQKNIFWKGNISSENFKISETASFSIITYARALQSQLASSLNQSKLSAENQSIVKALLLGLRDDINPETYQQYIDAGAIHILAISGLHIGIITLMLSFLLHFIFPNQKHKLLITITLIGSLWAYALLTGLSASVTRSVTMFSFLSIGIGLKKYQGIYDNLILSVFISLIFNPFLLFDVGFQLSYTAVFSIVTFVPIFNKFWFPQNKIIRLFYSILSVSFATQIGILPISLYYFHQFPTLFFVTNLLILPFLGIILGLGIWVITLSFFDILPNFLGVGYDFILTKMNATISFIASFEHLVFKQIYFDYSMLMISLIGIIFLSVWLHLKKIQFLYGFLGCCIVFQCIVFHHKYQTSQIAQLIVFQQHKSTLIGIQEGKKLTLLHDKENVNNSSLLNNFLSNTNTQLYKSSDIPYLLSFDNETFWIIDKAYSIDDLPQIDYILLRNSPKIHLEKLLLKVCPKGLIADGSNSFWEIKNWKNTCQKLQIPFHSTSEKGYFVLKKTP